MTNFKLSTFVVLCGLSINGFAARDFSQSLPFQGDVVVGQFDEVSAYKLSNQENGKKIICTVRAAHPQTEGHAVRVYFDYANFNFGFNNSEPGLYKLIDQYPLTFVIADSTSRLPGYNSTIRFVNKSWYIDSDITVNCEYQ